MTRTLAAALLLLASKTAEAQPTAVGEVIVFKEATGPFDNRTPVRIVAIVPVDDSGGPSEKAQKRS